MTYIQGTLPPFPTPNEYEDFSAAIDIWSREAAKYVETNMETVRQAVQEVIWEPGTLDHGDMTGLTDDDHSSLYLLLSGARALTGNWDVGGFNITNIGSLGAGVATLASGSTIGTLTLADGSITDSGGTISFGNENLSTSGTLSAGATTCTTLKTHTNAITSGSEISYKTAALTPDYVGIIEIISDSSNLIPSGVSGGIEVEAYFDPDDSANAFQFGGAFFANPTGTITTTANTIIGIYGGLTGAIVNNGYNLPRLAGLQFDCRNDASFDGGLAKAGNKTLNTFGIRVTSYLGSDGKIISNLADVENYGGYFDGLIDGTYNSTRTDGVNYGVYAKTTDSLTDMANGTVLTSYGLYIDACADNTLGSGGVLTSWGLYEANGRNNAFAGKVRIGSLVAPTVEFDLTGAALISSTLGVTGAALFSSTLDVVGNIDPTSYETTRGGFKDEDDMASNSATATVSQQSLVAYTGGKICSWTQSIDVNILSYSEWGNGATLATYAGGPSSIRYITIDRDFGDGGLFGVQVPVPTDWDAASDITINVIWIITNDQGARTNLDVKATVMPFGSGEDVDGLAVQTLTNDHVWAGARTTGNVELITLTIDYDDGGAPVSANDVLKIRYGRGEHAAFPDAGQFDSNCGAVCMWLDYTRKASV